MKPSLLFIICAVLFCCTSQSCTPKNTSTSSNGGNNQALAKTSPTSQDSFSVLFVGNSLTYTYNVPTVLEMIGAKFGEKITTVSLTKPNYALEDHWNEGRLQKLIQSGRFNQVIVQQGPSSQPPGRASLIAYGKKIKTVCDAASTSLGFYMVWPSKYYYRTFDGVIANYTEAAKTNQSMLFPAGVVWKAYDKLEKKESLYGPDQFHPSPAGSFLAALTIFHKLYPAKDLKAMKLKDYKIFFKDKASFKTVVELVSQN